MRYLLATNNPGKVIEIKALFERYDLKFTSLSELGFFLEPTEDGTTFTDNAIIKATETSNFLRNNGYSDIAVIADDSGLCIDALDGEPGVDSANFMGRETPYEIRNAHIIDKVNSMNSTRTARFVCVIACVFPCGKVVTTEGVMNGEIAKMQIGANGFGYDPIFYVPSLGKTTAELTIEQKAKISHRAKALSLMIDMLKG